MAPDPAERGGNRDPEGSAVKNDPWGIRRAENLRGSLQGVLSARVVASPVGEIQEVHVFTQGGLAPKQVVRNVESALLAHLGLKVDHRKISVAQTAEVRPINVLEADAVRAKASRRGIVFEKLEVTPLERQRVKFTLTLDFGGNQIVSEEDAADTPRARIQAGARVAVRGVDKVLPKGTVDLEGATVVEAFNSRFAFVGVYIVHGRETLMVTGSCEITEGEEQAAALAVLDATNRWVHSLV